MSKKSKQEILPPERLPAPSTPYPSLPSLPAHSGKVWGRATTILKSDTEYVSQHAEYLKARAQQASAMRALVENQHALAAAFAGIASLPEEVAWNYLMGRSKRQHLLTMQSIEHQKAEVASLTELAYLQKNLDDAHPNFKRPEPPASSNSGISADEVEELMRHLPELDPDLITTLRRLILGRIEEKKS